MNLISESPESYPASYIICQTISFKRTQYCIYLKKTPKGGITLYASSVQLYILDEERSTDITADGLRDSDNFVHG